MMFGKDYLEKYKVCIGHRKTIRSPSFHSRFIDKSKSDKKHNVIKDYYSISSINKCIRELSDSGKKNILIVSYGNLYTDVLREVVKNNEKVSYVNR